MAEHSTTPGRPPSPAQITDTASNDEAIARSVAAIKRSNALLARLRNRYEVRPFGGRQHR